MANRWNKVSVEEARRHPLYGVRGWLLVFSIGLVLGLLKELGVLVGEAGKAGMSLGDFLSIDHPAISYAKFAIGLQMMMVLVIYFLLASKHSSFRNAASAILLVSWPIAALVGFANPFPGFANTIAQALILWVMSCAVWVTYLQRSKRVRVTFENLVAAEVSATNIGVAKNRHTMMTEPNVVDDTTQLQVPILAFADSSPGVSSRVPVEEYWAAALAEFEGARRRPGLWARVFAEAGGEEARAKAAYLSHRARELEEEHARLVLAVEREERNRTREAELANLSQEQQVYERLPKGCCPNCKSTIPLASLTCPKCGAMFGTGSAWHVTPLEEK